MDEILYAVYPGSVTLYDGTTATLTGPELAELFGVQDEDYLTVTGPENEPQGEDAMRYIHLTPRADGIYPNMKVATHDDDEEITWDRDFDGSKQYTQETNWETYSE